MPEVDGRQNKDLRQFLPSSTNQKCRLVDNAARGVNIVLTPVNRAPLSKIQLCQCIGLCRNFGYQAAEQELDSFESGIDRGGSFIDDGQFCRQPLIVVEHGEVLENPVHDDVDLSEFKRLGEVIEGTAPDGFNGGLN